MTPTDDTTGDNYRDPDLVGAEAAMWRAAQRARDRAARVGRGVMVWIDGQVVEACRVAVISHLVNTAGDCHAP